ncbi:hypothetical protein Q9R46_13080 [Paenibacillus sp. RRE4]|uniref:hypothetical protein n=1 Tax=Paenibacillus sp. RRE4 TaxID=2962587 RepID=UPI002881E50A|nr:hypothetical protein [Paenibacillus sp. RRE4]MDT0123585.1 hypothetical protein [Paenibacillus sp. RRE4]
MGKEPASVTVLSFWFAFFLERLGARSGNTGLSSADALDPRCDLGKEIEVIGGSPTVSAATAVSATKLVCEAEFRPVFSLLSE